MPSQPAKSVRTAAKLAPTGFLRKARRAVAPSQTSQRSAALSQNGAVILLPSPRAECAQRLATKPIAHFETEDRSVTAIDAQRGFASEPCFGRLLQEGINGKRVLFQQHGADDRFAGPQRVFG